MRKTTRDHRLYGAILVAVVVVAIMLLLTGGMILDYFGKDTHSFDVALIVICTSFFLAITVGVVIALIQRWREIKGGEEDEARKY